MAFIQYEHHGASVWVREAQKGKHWDHCLCVKCYKFDMFNRDTNCPIANEVYRLCVLLDLALPVWECPKFDKKLGEE
jgi:hypothetical protein